MAGRVILVVGPVPDGADVNLQEIASRIPSPLAFEVLDSLLDSVNLALAERLKMHPRVEGVIFVPAEEAAFSVDTTTPSRKSTVYDAFRSLIFIVKTETPSAMRIVYSRLASTNPVLRYDLCSKYDCHMVTHVPEHLENVLAIIANETGSGNLTCPVCEKQHLTPVELWHHVPMYHVNNKKSLSMVHYPCPICGMRSRQPFPVHLHEEHAPLGVHVEAGRSMPPAVSFGLCVIRRKCDGKFLVVQEYENQGYWLPGGGIDSKEMPHHAAVRECLEEAGIHVELTGILRVEVNPLPNYIRLRYIFYGHPISEDEPCKTFPDFESVGACWVDVDDLLRPGVKWRGSEPDDWFRYVIAGGHIAPISMLTMEGERPTLPHQHPEQKI